MNKNELARLRYVPSGPFGITSEELLAFVCELWVEISKDRVSPKVERLHTRESLLLTMYSAREILEQLTRESSLFEVQAAIHNACLAGRPPKGLWAWCEFELRYLGND